MKVFTQGNGYFHFLCDVGVLEFLGFGERLA
jgi:hypothetical protein